MERPKKLYKGELLSISQIWYRENKTHVKEYNQALNKGTPKGRPIVNHTEEERKASLKRALDKYNKTPKAKATSKRLQALWLKTPKGKATNRKSVAEYNKTPKGKATMKKSVKKYIKNNPHISRWRRLLKSALLRLNQSKNDTTLNLLKYSAIELLEHLEKAGYKKDIHDVDHKIPVSWFINTAPPHIVNSLHNLQPLTKEENINKSNSFADPVEESYYHESFPFIKSGYKQSISIIFGL